MSARSQALAGVRNPGGDDGAFPCLRPTKFCPKCGADKDISEFNRRRSSKDGYQRYCRYCARTLEQTYRELYGRSGPERRKYLKRKTESPHKLAARYTLRYAVRVGKIIKLPCAVCGDSRSEAHHGDYSKPLDVIWLCKKHHDELHRGNAA